MELDLEMQISVFDGTEKLKIETKQIVIKLIGILKPKETKNISKE